MAFGELSLLPDDFYRMSWREFFITLKGRRKATQDRYLMDSLLTRELAYQVYTSIPLKKGKRHTPKKKYWPHPWDQEDEGREIEQMKAAMDALRDRGTGAGRPQNKK